MHTTKGKRKRKRAEKCAHLIKPKMDDRMAVSSAESRGECAVDAPGPPKAPS